LGVIDDSEHLTAVNVISFLNPHFDDVPHHLTGEIAGLRSAHGSHRLQHIGDILLLDREHANIPHRFRGRHFRLLLNRATAQAEHKGCYETSES
jgi:hypothetical protein